MQIIPDASVKVVQFYVRNAVQKNDRITMYEPTRQVQTHTSFSLSVLRSLKSIFSREESRRGARSEYLGEMTLIMTDIYVRFQALWPLVGTFARSICPFLYGHKTPQQRIGVLVSRCLLTIATKRLRDTGSNILSPR